jgi:uncharacterized protein YjiS (DUF1127 family)
MATTELSQSPSATTGEKLRLAVEAGLARLAALWRSAQNRRKVARLLEWDAHMLRDIGLTPGDVRAAMASPMHDDPSNHLGALSLERRMASHATARERLDRQGYFLRTMLPKAPRPRLPSGGGDRLSA